MPSNTERLEQIVTMYARYNHQLHRVVCDRGSHDPEVVDDACLHAWMKLLVAEDIDLRPPRWGALAWLTTCAVRHAWLLTAEAVRDSDRPRRARHPNHRVGGTLPPARPAA